MLLLFTLYSVFFRFIYHFSGGEFSFYIERVLAIPSKLKSYAKRVVKDTFLKGSNRLKESFPSLLAVVKDTFLKGSNRLLCLSCSLSSVVKDTFLKGSNRPRLSDDYLAIVVKDTFLKGSNRIAITFFV